MQGILLIFVKISFLKNIVIAWLNRSSSACDQGNEEDHEEDKEEYFSDAGCCACNTTKA